MHQTDIDRLRGESDDAAAETKRYRTEAHSAREQANREQRAAQKSLTELEECQRENIDLKRSLREIESKVRFQLNLSMIFQLRS